jgi:hypothetical protein
VISAAQDDRQEAFGGFVAMKPQSAVIIMTLSASVLAEALANSASMALAPLQFIMQRGRPDEFESLPVLP